MNRFLSVNYNNINEILNKASKNDYIPAKSSEIIAHTAMIGGGETTEIEFVAPEPGVYDYICSFPGHYAMMRGKLIVK